MRVSFPGSPGDASSFESVTLNSSEGEVGGRDESAGCQFVSASSIANELFSSSVRNTVASFVRPAAMAASS